MTKSEAGKKGQLISSEWHKKQYLNRQQNYYNNPTTCIKCNNILHYSKRKNKFCSHSCSATISNKNRTIVNNCIKCNKICKKSSIYCSTTCHKETLRSNRDQIVYTTKNINDVYKTPASAKKFLLRTNGHICSICKGTSWNNLPMPLVMDHIDGNSDNWNVDNLRLICGNCDMQTSTYKSKNIGKGRHSRRLRYKQGKSF